MNRQDAKTPRGKGLTTETQRTQRAEGRNDYFSQVLSVFSVSLWSILPSYLCAFVPLWFMFPGGAA